MSNPYPVLVAACVAVTILGLWGIALALWGRPTDNVFRSRTSRLRSSGALTLSRSRLRRTGVAVGAGILVLVATGWPIAALFTTGLILGAGYFFGGAKIAARQIARLEGVEQWTRHLADAMAVGGMPVQTIIRSADTAPEAIRPEVTRLADRLRTPRLDKTDALRSFADDLDDALGDIVVLALTRAVTSGAQRVPYILQTLAEAVSAEVKARRSMEKLRAGPRKEVQTIIVVLAAGACGLVMLTNYGAAYDSVDGQVVLAGLCGMVLLALTMMRRLSVGGQPPRILPQRGRDERTSP